jgi:hypothetical protein
MEIENYEIRVCDIGGASLWGLGFLQKNSVTLLFFGKKS